MKDELAMNPEPGGKSRPLVPGREQAEDFRTLSQRILESANRGATREDFLEEVAGLLSDFSGSDHVELWLKEGGKLFRCLDSRQAQPRFRLEALPDPVAQPASVLEDLASRILRGQFDPSLPFFTKNGSFWTGDVESAFSALVKADGRGDEDGPFFGWDHRSLALIPLVIGRETIGLLQLWAKPRDAFAPGTIGFFEDVAQMLGVALAHRHSQVALRERIKELTCLYGIAQLVERVDVSLEEILQSIALLLPPAMLYPEIASARITLDGRTLQTDPFHESGRTLSAEILQDEKRRGRVDVAYGEERPDRDEGPFLKEERDLLDAVAGEIAQILERKQAEEEQARLQEQLMHADRLATIGQLAAGVAHELNEPLGSILGFAQLVKKEDGLPPQARTDIEKIEAAALHAREVVRKLLIFARQMPTKKAPIELNKVVEEGLYILGSRCAKEGIALERDLAPDLPEITADHSQLTQVLVNLVVNAIQAMPQGGRLGVRTSVGEEWVSLAVEDTGIGMSEEVRKKLFIPFFTTKEVGQGTGLGLPVVHGIVTAHGGSIHVESEVGRGSRFEIRLPAARPPVPKERSRDVRHP